MNDNLRLFDLLQYQLDNFPKPDMINGKENDSWRNYSTAEITETVTKLSAGLISLGISGGDMTVENQDKIALVSKNRPEWLMLDLACQQIGALLCPIYPTTNVYELEFIFNDAGIKLAFISGRDISEKVETIRARVPSLQNVYSFDNQPAFDHWETILSLPDETDFAKLEAIKKNISADHCATIIYTSGTTGEPKGVMLSHRNIVSNVMNSIKSFPFEKDVEARALSFLPLNHIFERMVSYIYIYSGISIFYAETLESIGENLKEVKPNIFCTVPRLLEKVYEKIMSKGASLSGVKRKLFDWAVALADSTTTKRPGGWAYNLQLALANKLVFSKWREAVGNQIDFIITAAPPARSD
jgi:long-chain acyl-CoA synthetase